MSNRSNSDAPLVSVVLPTYDRPALVRKAVASVGAQTYPNVELLVVDDCSPTPVEQALEGLSLGPSIAVRVLRHEENRGGNAARNTGIRVAAGEYVAFLDDDDRWHPENRPPGTSVSRIVARGQCRVRRPALRRRQGRDDPAPDAERDRRRHRGRPSRCDARPLLDAHGSSRCHRGGRLPRRAISGLTGPRVARPALTGR